MKTVLSFDVGMKNLAYCLFQIGNGNGDSNSNSDNNNTDNLTDYKVLQWEVINLCTPIVKKCNNGDCKEIAKYCKMFKVGEQDNDNDDNEETVIKKYSSDKYISFIYYLILALSKIEFFWGQVERWINLNKNDKDFDLYTPGNIVTWI